VLEVSSVYHDGLALRHRAFTYLERTRWSDDDRRNAWSGLRFLLIDCPEEILQGEDWLIREHRSIRDVLWRLDHLGACDVLRHVEELRFEA
jgi:hypothetical protein